MTVDGDWRIADADERPKLTAISHMKAQLCIAEVLRNITDTAD